MKVRFLSAVVFSLVFAAAAGAQDASQAPPTRRIMVRAALGAVMGVAVTAGAGWGWAWPAAVV